MRWIDALEDAKETGNITILIEENVATVNCNTAECRVECEEDQAICAISYYRIADVPDKVFEPDLIELTEFINSVKNNG